MPARDGPRPVRAEIQVPFIVMEHVDGTLLKDIVAAGPARPGGGRSASSTASWSPSSTRIARVSCTATSSRATSWSPRPVR
jgi:hypothetical protein